MEQQNTRWDTACSAVWQHWDFLGGGSHYTVSRHLCSMMRDQTWAPCSGSSVLTTGQPGSSLHWDFFSKDSVGVGVTFGHMGDAGRGWDEVG